MPEADISEVEPDYKEIKTSVWRTIEYLGMPASNVNFVDVSGEIPEPTEPKEASKIRKGSERNGHMGA